MFPPQGGIENRISMSHSTVGSCISQPPACSPTRILVFMHAPGLITTLACLHDQIILVCTYLLGLLLSHSSSLTKVIFGGLF
jgi:hypothetical protein